TLAVEAAALLRHRPAAEIVLSGDRTADVDLVRTALGRFTARARSLPRTLGRTADAARSARRRRRARRPRHDHRTPVHRAGRTARRGAGRTRLLWRRGRRGCRRTHADLLDL